MSTWDEISLPAENEATPFTGSPSTQGPTTYKGPTWIPQMTQIARWHLLCKGGSVGSQCFYQFLHDFPTDRQTIQEHFTPNPMSNNHQKLCTKNPHRATSFYNRDAEKVKTIRILQHAALPIIKLIEESTPNTTTGRLAHHALNQIALAIRQLDTAREHQFDYVQPNPSRKRHATDATI
jgi:hypothetical protein